MKYWVYLDGKVPGAFTARELTELPGFTRTALVCPAEGRVLDKNWRPAGEHSELAQALGLFPKPALDPRPEDVAAGAPLFEKVSALMGELRARRDEGGLLGELHGRIDALQGKLAEAQTKIEDLHRQLAEKDVALARAEAAQQALQKFLSEKP